MPVVRAEPKGSYAISDSYLDSADQYLMTVAEQTEHVLENELELYLKDHLSKESLAVIDSHLASCQACCSKLAEQDKCLWYMAELTAGEVDGERRRHPRVATDDPATVQILHPFSAGIWDVRIVDVSKSGLRAHTPKSLPPGSLIKVRMQCSVGCGDVRYCIPAESGFYVGVRLHDYFVPKI